MAEKAKKSKVESESSSSSESSDSSDSDNKEEKGSKYAKMIRKLKEIKKKVDKKEREKERLEKKLKAEKEANAELTQFANEQTEAIYKLKSDKDGFKNTDSLLKNTEDRMKKEITRTEDRMKKEIVKNTDYLKEKFDRSLKDLKSALTWVQDNMARKQEDPQNTADLMEAETRIIGESYQEEYFTTHGNDYSTPSGQRLTKTIDTTDDLRNRITTDRYEDNTRTVMERRDESVGNVDLAKENAKLKKVIANLQSKNVWVKGEIISTVDRVNDELHNTNASMQSTSGNKYHAKNSTPAGASPALRQPDRPDYWSNQRHSPVRRRSPPREANNRRDPNDGRNQHERRDHDDRRHRTPRQDERDERVRNKDRR